MQGSQHTKEFTKTLWLAWAERGRQALSKLPAENLGQNPGQRFPVQLNFKKSSCHLGVPQRPPVSTLLALQPSRKLERKCALSGGAGASCLGALWLGGAISRSPRHHHPFVPVVLPIPSLDDERKKFSFQGKAQILWPSPEALRLPEQAGRGQLNGERMCSREMAWECTLYDG